MEKVRISSIQLFLLLVGFLFGSLAVINPVFSAKNDAWMAILLGGAGGALLMTIYVVIALRNPSKTLVGILRARFGKIVGNVIAILYIWYFIHLASLVLRNFGEFICIANFPETPMVVIISMFAVVLLYAVNSGIEVISRLTELSVPILPVVALIICLGIITTHDFTAFLPILENGIKPVISAAFAFISFLFGESIVFLMLFKNLNKKENLKRISLLSVAFMVLLTLLIFFRDITVLGSDLMQQATFIPHLSALVIPSLNVEPLINFNLLIGGGIKGSISIYAAVKGISELAGISDYRKLTTAITTFCVVLSVWLYENILEMFSWGKEVWPYYSIPFQIVIPILLLILSLRKNNNLKTNDIVK